MLTCVPLFHRLVMHMATTIFGCYFVTPISSPIHIMFERCIYSLDSQALMIHYLAGYQELIPESPPLFRLLKLLCLPTQWIACLLPAHCLFVGPSNPIELLQEFGPYAYVCPSHCLLKL